MASTKDARMPLLDHLRELRKRVFRAAVAIFLASGIGWYFYNTIITTLAQPVCDLKSAQESGSASCGSLYINGVLGPLNLQIKVALLSGVIVSAPFWLYQLWAFIAPGLYAHEKKFMVPMIVASCCLFLMGMAFAYFLVLPVIFGFIISAAPVGVAVMTDIANYLDFVIGLFFAFGLAFQVPIAVILVVYFGWFDVIDDIEVTKVLIEKVIELGKKNNLEHIDNTGKITKLPDTYRVYQYIESLKIL